MTLTFKGREYPAVETKYGIVSTESLEKAIIGKDGCPVDQEAYEIDSEVFFFVPDDEIKKSVPEIEEYVRNNIV